MKLYQRFAEKGYHTSVVTTFGIDFDAYENVVLARLRGAGCRNNLVVTDGRMLTYALDSRSALPVHAGSRYTVRGIGGRGGGVFHPKLFLQVGREGARLMVGSANMTATGLAGNLELVATIRCGQDESGERQLIAQAWRHLAGLLDPEQMAQAEWMLARAPWLRTAVPPSGPVRLADGTEGALLFSGHGEGIGRRFARLVGAPVSRLIAISPYWDDSLEALTDLSQQIKPERTGILIDPSTQAFPAAAAAHRLPELAVYARRGLGETRFMHAKAILALAEDADHVLIGSANCTWAALGGSSGAGLNTEACVYRRVPPGTALGALNLTASLAEDRRVNVSDLPPFHAGDDISLEALAERSPGAFLLQGDRLTWRPPSGLGKPERFVVILVDRSGVDLGLDVEQHRRDGNGMHYLVHGTDSNPTFARVTSPEGVDSALAIITRLDQLKEEVREVGSRRTEALRDRLALGGDTEATLELLQIINELEHSGSDRPSLGQAMSIPRPEQGENAEPALGRAYRRLTYEEFMAHRRPQGESPRLPTSFAGTDLSLVRGVLNRIVGAEPAGSIAHDEADDGATVVAAFSLGDESAAQGGDDDSGSNRDMLAMGQVRTPRATQVATAKEIADAVSSFSKLTRAKREGGELSATDLLRLRAILLVVCCAALPPAPEGNTGPTRSALQVLPAEGSKQTWWLTIGRLLYAIFRPKDPAMGLSLTDEHDRVPVDILECWATCYWCLQACLAAGVGSAAQQRIRSHVGPLTERLYESTMLTWDELVSGPVNETMACMSERLAERMGVDPEQIAAAHEDMALRFGNP